MLNETFSRFFQTLWGPYSFQKKNRGKVWRKNWCSCIYVVVAKLQFLFRPPFVSPRRRSSFCKKGLLYSSVSGKCKSLKWTLCLRYPKALDCLLLCGFNIWTMQSDQKPGEQQRCFGFRFALISDLLILYLENH